MLSCSPGHSFDVSVGSPSPALFLSPDVSEQYVSGEFAPLAGERSTGNKSARHHTRIVTLVLSCMLLAQLNQCCVAADLSTHSLSSSDSSSLAQMPLGRSDVSSLECFPLENLYPSESLSLHTLRQGYELYTCVV